MDVTPDIARKWLDSLSPNQRKVDPIRITAYANMMKNGEWKLGTDMIGFDEKAKLINGQTRLNAVIESGCIIRFVVAYGVSSDAELAIDSGKPRTFLQHARYFGKPYKTNEYGIAKIIEAGKRDEELGIKLRASYPQQWDLIEKHYEAIEFVTKNPEKRKRLPAVTILGIVARAWYTQDREKLKEFLTILQVGGKTTGKDSGAVLLRDLWLSGQSFSGHARTDLYKKTESALDAFLKGRHISKLNKTEMELFPVKKK